MSAKIAIVGSGPSGCYLAQALLKLDSGLQVNVIDALPVPYGLVRYGVAADHQGTKAVTRQFSRIFERQGARFFGNVHVGRDISLNALRQAFDVVVLAAGLSLDRRLGIPGDDLPGIYGASCLTRALHEHPEAKTLPDLGRNPVIVGNGNVAIDLLRLLAKSPDELEGTDLGPLPSDWLGRNSFESITILGRSPASQAKFDPVMIRELAKLRNVSIEVIGADQAEDAEQAKRLEALAEIHKPSQARTAIRFRFALQPVAVEGEESVTGLRVRDTSGVEEVIPASSIVTAIGFRSSGDLDRSRWMTEGVSETGRLAPGLYAAGWFRRGPRGTIPESREEGQLLASTILAETEPASDRPGRAILERLPGVVDFAGWQRIDEIELSSAPPGRCRRKLSTTEDLLRVATDQEHSI